TRATDSHSRYVSPKAPTCRWRKASTSASATSSHPTSAPFRPPATFPRFAGEGLLFAPPCAAGGTVAQATEGAFLRFPRLRGKLPVGVRGAGVALEARHRGDAKKRPLPAFGHLPPLRRGRAAFSLPLRQRGSWRASDRGGFSPLPPRAGEAPRRDEGGRRRARSPSSRRCEKRPLPASGHLPPLRRGRAAFSLPPAAAGGAGAQATEGAFLRFPRVRGK